MSVSPERSRSPPASRRLMREHSESVLDALAVELARPIPFAQTPVMPLACEEVSPTEVQSSCGSFAPTVVDAEVQSHGDSYASTVLGAADDDDSLMRLAQQSPAPASPSSCDFDDDSKDSFD
eukprot:9450488-Karenia_brevis.AAC.1